MIKFILNNKEVNTDLPAGMLVLDFVRYHQHLHGTKIGCREGDCGACTILAGELKDGEVVYRSYTSCLTPLGNIHGKHVVTIEGLNMAGLNPVQQAMADCSATQCGFCTPGFVVSLSGFCLSAKEPSIENATAAIDGNICRCTGYKSIERAAAQVAQLMDGRTAEDSLQFAADKGLMPAYFATIKDRLKLLHLHLNDESDNVKQMATFVGGGTDLYVQKHDEMKWADIQFMYARQKLKAITRTGNTVTISGSATVTDLQESKIIQSIFPAFNRYIKFISSTPIRNMATVAGNFINASPIGDFSIFFLALDAQLVLSNDQNDRQLPLRKLYLGYKQLDLHAGEYVKEISFVVPGEKFLFNFEKVSKRQHLDIASVNTAIVIMAEDNIVTAAGLSAGGVGPIPMYLPQTSAFLKDKKLNEELVIAAVQIAQSEVSPISDARGTVEYKKLLLSQLIKAHFITLFPNLNVEKLLLEKA